MAYSREILVILSSYIIGCISTGYYLTLIYTGKDIRHLGSGSCGARNVGRVLGKRGFIITFFADMAKGMLVVWIGTYWGINGWARWLSVICVLAGHIWPAQNKFQGGKGIAVTIGALLVLNYLIVLYALIVFGLGYIVSKKYTTSSAIAILAMPIYAILVKNHWLDVIWVTIIMSIILFAHRRNIYQFFSRVSIKGDQRI